MRKKPHDWLVRLTDYELGWLVGLIEGDGCFTRDGQNLCAQIRMTDLDTVSKVARLFGASVNGPYQSGEGDGHKRKPVYMCSLRGKRARSLMVALQPYMSLRRQNKIQELMGSQIELFEFPRDLPEKREC